MRDRQFRHANKYRLPALMMGLVGAVAVLTAAATPAVACWLPKPPQHDCAFPFGGSSPFHGSKSCGTPTPTPSHSLTPPPPTQTVTVPAPTQTVTVAAPTTTVTSTVTNAASATSSTPAGVGGVSTSRHAPAAVSDTPIAVPPAAIPTGVSAGHAVSDAVPLISEIGGAAGAVLLFVAFVLYYRRRPGSHTD